MLILFNFYLQIAMQKGHFASFYFVFSSHELDCIKTRKRSYVYQGPKLAYTIILCVWGLLFLLYSQKHEIWVVCKWRITISIFILKLTHWAPIRSAILRYFAECPVSMLLWIIRKKEYFKAVFVIEDRQVPHRTYEILMVLLPQVSEVKFK